LPNSIDLMPTFTHYRVGIGSNLLLLREMERLKPLPHGFLASNLPAQNTFPTKPVGESSNPRSSKRNGPSPVASSNQINHKKTFAIDSKPLPGQIVYPDHLRSSSTGDSSTVVESENAETMASGDEDSSPETFWIQVSATHLKRADAARIDPVCVVYLGGRQLHKTEVVFDDDEPDFRVGLKLEASCLSCASLEFRILDASILELEDSVHDAGAVVSDACLSKAMGPDNKSALLLQCSVQFEELVAIICRNSRDPRASLIYKKADQQRRSLLFLALYPMRRETLAVLEDNRKHIFDLGSSSYAITDRPTMQHEPVLEVLPWHLRTVQNSVASVSIRDTHSEPKEMQDQAVFNLVLEALLLKNSCLGGSPTVNVERARCHPDYRCGSVAQIFVTAVAAQRCAPPNSEN
jgi:hypothetical protein